MPTGRRQASCLLYLQAWSGMLLTPIGTAVEQLQRVFRGVGKIGWFGIDG